MSRRFAVIIRVHWADTDAAGIVWFGNFFRYFEEAEDELFRARGRPRIEVIAERNIFMPRVDVNCRFHSPARMGEALEIGVGVSQVNPRRLQYSFEVREQVSRRLVAEGQDEIEALAEERQKHIDALQSTRSYRMLAPLRAVFGRRG